MAKDDKKKDDKKQDMAKDDKKKDDKKDKDSKKRPDKKDKDLKKDDKKKGNNKSAVDAKKSEKSLKSTASKKSKPNKKASKDKSKDDDDPSKKKKLKHRKKKNILYGDEAKRAYCQYLVTSLQPIRILAMLFGQFPLHYAKSKTTGLFVFKFSWFHPNSVYFGFMMLISYYALIMGGWNLFVTVVDVHEISNPTPDDLEERWLEKSLLHRHLTWVISMLAAVIQTCVSMFCLYRNRFYAPSVFSFYSKIVYQLHMDISEGALILPLVMILLFTFTTIGIVVMGVFKFTPVTVSSPTLFGVYLFRVFFIGRGVWIREDEVYRQSLQILGAVLLVIIFTASKIQMFMFIYHCKLLRNAFAVWNGRAYIALMKGGKYFHTEEGRFTYKLLYKDHCVLLDLLEGANRLCAGCVEMYYGLQTATIFFECYFFLRSIRYGTQYNEAVEGENTFFVRPYDWIPGFFLVFQSIIIALVTSKTAADVGQEAYAGLDIVRRKTMLFRKTDDDLLFQLSMQASYNSFMKFDVVCGGYEYFDIDWIMGYLNNVAGYFIILYQFQPVMDRGTPNYQQRENLGKFLESLENLPRNHYTSSTPRPIITYSV